MANCRTPEQELLAREELLAACTRVFLTEGFEQATMKRLAEEAHCSTGRFYSNFTGKHDILRCLWSKLCPMAQTAVQPLAENGEPLLSGLLLCGLVLEAGRLNEPFCELLRCGLAEPNILSDTTDFFRPIFSSASLRAERDGGTAAGEACGDPEIAEQKARLFAFLALGMLQGQLLRIKPDDPEDRTCREDAWFYEALLRLYRVPEAEIAPLLAAAETRRAALREAAYRWLIRILSCRFDCPANAPHK